MVMNVYMNVQVVFHTQNLQAHARIESILHVSALSKEQIFGFNYILLTINYINMYCNIMALFSGICNRI